MPGCTGLTGRCSPPNPFTVGASNQRPTSARYVRGAGCVTLRTWRRTRGAEERDSLEARVGGSRSDWLLPGKFSERVDRFEWSSCGSRTTPQPLHGAVPPGLPSPDSPGIRPLAVIAWYRFAFFCRHPGPIFFWCGRTVGDGSGCWRVFLYGDSPCLAASDGGINYSENPGRCAKNRSSLVRISWRRKPPFFYAVIPVGTRSRRMTCSFSADRPVPSRLPRDRVHVFLTGTVRPVDSMFLTVRVRTAFPFRPLFSEPSSPPGFGRFRRPSSSSPRPHRWNRSARP